MNGIEIKNKDLKRRIIEISYKHKLSHLGSCLTAVDIIKDIYDLKKPDEKFVLSQGHAGLAYYVVAEKYLGIDAEKALGEQGIHPDRINDTQGFVDCSTGSLGQGLPIALGMALADRSKNVYCLISDGESQEGSTFEAWRIWGDLGVNNLKIYTNVNGFGGYGEINRTAFTGTEKCYTNVDYLPFLKGLEGHYHVMSEDDYKLAMEVLQ